MNSVIHKPFFKHALACIIAGVIGAIVIGRVGKRYLPFIPFTLIVGIALIYLAACCIYSFVWKRKARIHLAGNVKELAFWENVIRCFIAFDMIVFGLGKIFHLQFRTPLGVLDNPFSSISSDQLMWAFFGRSYAFIVCIACLQIIAALLIIFNKTKLFGVVFLLPILLNIFFIDIFYNVGVVVTMYCLLLIIACIYLLLLEYDRLIQIFFIRDVSVAFSQNTLWSNIAKGLIVLIPVLLIIINRFPLFFPEYNGKYIVKHVIIEGAPPHASTCKDSVLTKIFIDADNHDFVFEYNDYKKRLIGTYQYDETTHKLTATWRYPQNKHDTLFAKLLSGKMIGTKTLIGQMGKEKFRIEMQKVLQKGD